MFDDIDNMAQIEREIEGFRGSATVNFPVKIYSC